MIKRYKILARGDIGFIIPGYMYVHPLGQAMKKQTGIYSDKMLPGLKELAETIHQEGGKVVFQLSHAGPPDLQKDYRTHSVGPVCQ